MVLVLPILVPLLTALATLVIRRNPLAQRVVHLAGSVAVVGVAGRLVARVLGEGLVVSQIGGWPAPYGITLVADALSAILVGLTALLGFAVSVYSIAGVRREVVRWDYYALLNVMLGGLSGIFLAGDLFNLYVWFEVMLIASFALQPLGGMPEQLRASMKYIVLNLIGSTLLLGAVGLAYGLTGTLNLADMAVRLSSIDAPQATRNVALFFVVAAGIKAAIFPLYFWLPAAYPVAPPPIVALFSGLLTKVGIYVLLRLFTLLFPIHPGFAQTLFLVLAGVTMVVGVLGAVAQMDVRRLLSFHIVSQIGYLLMGIGFATAASISAVVFFLMHVVLAKATLFLVSGYVARVTGEYDLERLGGLLRGSTLISIAFAIPALSLAGLPPFSGFWAKLALVRAGLALDQYAMVGISLAVSVLTLYSMTKIWSYAFLAEPSPSAPERVRASLAALSLSDRAPYVISTGLLVLTILALGLVAEPFLALSDLAAGQLLDRTGYVHAVLGVISP